MVHIHIQTRKYKYNFFSFKTTLRVHT